MRYLVSTLFLVLLLAACQGQSRLERQGDRKSYFFDYNRAITKYEKAYERDTTSLPVLEKLATTARLYDNWKRAVIYYQKLVTGGSTDPKHIYYLAQAQTASGQYNNARQSYLAYYNQTGDVEAQCLAAELEDIESLQVEGFSVREATINSIHSDFSPVLHNNQLFFTTNREPSTFGAKDQQTGQGFMQIYVATCEDEDSLHKLKDIVPIAGKRVNGRYHDGPISIHPTTGDLYFTRSNYVKRKSFGNKEGLVVLKIFKTSFNPESQTWDTDLAEAVPFNSDNYGVGHPSFSADGNTLYFVSDMPGGVGGTDLWKSTWSGESWGAPEHLGNTVNSKDDEMFPWAGKSGKLYFASRGFYGLGGLDLFVSEVDGSGKLSAPENLGASINTRWDDFGMMWVDENSGYLSSNREGGFGDDDIYSFKRKNRVVRGFVYDQITGEALPNAAVVMVEGALSLTTDSNGLFIAELPYGQEYFDFTATKTDYLAQPSVKPYLAAPYDVKIPMLTTRQVSLKVLVRNKQTKEPISGADVTIEGGMSEQKKTDSEGYTYHILDFGQQYFIKGSAASLNPKIMYPAGYDTVSTIGMNTSGELESTLVLELDGLPLREEIVINNIYYDRDKYFIRPDAGGELDKLVRIMKENTSMIIEIGSHTDCRHSVTYNQKLSESRAKATRDYLVRNGISNSRILRTTGYGESRLINTCACECEEIDWQTNAKDFRDCEDQQVIDCGKDQHQQNRRTTFVIVNF